MGNSCVVPCGGRRKHLSAETASDVRLPSLKDNADRNDGRFHPCAKNGKHRDGDSVSREQTYLNTTSADDPEGRSDNASSIELVTELGWTPYPSFNWTSMWPKFETPATPENLKGVAGTSTHETAVALRLPIPLRQQPVESSAPSTQIPINGSKTSRDIISAISSLESKNDSRIVPTVVTAGRADILDEVSVVSVVKSTVNSNFEVTAAPFDGEPSDEASGEPGGEPTVVTCLGTSGCDAKRCDNDGAHLRSPYQNLGWLQYTLLAGEKTSITPTKSYTHHFGGASPTTAFVNLLKCSPLTSSVPKQNRFCATGSPSTMEKVYFYAGASRNNKATCDMASFATPSFDELATSAEGGRLLDLDEEAAGNHTYGSCILSQAPPSFRENTAPLVSPGKVSAAAGSPLGSFADQYTCKIQSVEEDAAATAAAAAAAPMPLTDLKRLRPELVLGEQRKRFREETIAIEEKTYENYFHTKHIPSNTPVATPQLQQQSQQRVSKVTRMRSRRTQPRICGVEETQIGSLKVPNDIRPGSSVARRRRRRPRRPHSLGSNSSSANVVPSMRPPRKSGTQQIVTKTETQVTEKSAAQDWKQQQHSCSPDPSFSFEEETGSPCQKLPTTAQKKRSSAVIPSTQQVTAKTMPSNDIEDGKLNPPLLGSPDRCTLSDLLVTTLDKPEPFCKSPDPGLLQLINVKKGSRKQSHKRGSNTGPERHQRPPKISLPTITCPAVVTLRDLTGTTIEEEMYRIDEATLEGNVKPVVPPPLESSSSVDGLNHRASAITYESFGDLLTYSNSSQVECEMTPSCGVGKSSLESGSVGALFPLNLAKCFSNRTSISGDDSYSVLSNRSVFSRNITQRDRASQQPLSTLIS